MRMQLKGRNLIPYGGTYRLNRPDLGMVGEGYLWDVLIKDVVRYRHSNGIKIGLGFEEEVERALCEAYPQECENVDEDRVVARQFTLSDIITGTQTMMSIWRNKKPLVSRQEAERRASICINCPQNTRFRKSCSGICPELKDVVSAIVDHQGTSYDWQLYSCNICACYLQAAIWVDAKSQIDPLSDKQRTQFESIPNCWKKASLLP